jgi:hypothetical protein
LTPPASPTSTGCAPAFTSPEIRGQAPVCLVS